MADPLCTLCQSPVRIIDVIDGKPVYAPAKAGINWNEWSAWAMRVLQTILIGLAAKWGFQADNKADVAATNSQAAVVKAEKLDEKVEVGIEQGRANHEAIKATREDTKSIKDKVVPKKTP